MIDLRSDYEFDGKILKNFVNLSGDERELVRNWRNDNNVRKWMFFDAIISLEEHRDFITHLQNDPKNAYWLVKSDEIYLGVVYLNKIDLRNRNAFIGIYKNPQKCIKGMGNSLMECIKKLSIEIGEFHTLKLEVLASNGRAITFYKKVGFIEEGKLRDFVFRNNKWQDVLIMGIVYRGI